MSKDEQDASQKESEIFENVIPSKHGRIFIGFPTHQTTSIKAHIAAHSVIPTVERENIDLNAKILKTWNAEMLRAAGILARIMYIDEMDELKRRAKGLKTSDLEALYGEAIHIMQQFTFELSTPSAMVGEYIAQAFWSCTRHSSIELLSTRGVLPSRQVRLSGDITFLDDLPLLPEQFLVGAQSFIENLKRAGYISEITITDIQNSLSASPLKDERVYAFLKWLSQQLQTGKMDDVQAPILLSGAIAMTPTKDSDGEVVENAIPISLGDIRHYINVSNLSADIPLPSYCLPFSLTKKLSVEDFTALGWKELEVADWVFYMANNSSKFPVEYNLEISPQFAGQVLAIISKNWERLSSTHKLLIIDALKVKKCIPTKQGMRLPKESYFSSVKLFTDLPTIHGVRNVKDKVLTDLGMRKTVELKLVFERLMGENAAGSGEKWSHVDLIKYLSSVKSDIPYEDIQKLRKMEMCKAEPSKSSKLYKVCDLYEPLAPLRSLNLPVLYWPGEWKEQSPEAKFLRNLGLSPIPSDEVLLKIASGPDKTLREKALRYFVDHYHLNNYSRTLVASTPHAFLPLQNNTRTLATPVQCYSNSESSILGFDIIRNDLQPHAMKFGVKSDPDMRECVKRLTENPPAGPREAQTIFGYFANRLKDLTTEIATHLGSSCIVPIRGSSGTRYIMPRICYIGSKDHKYAKVFDFVDFGTGPNAFLMHCGSKPEPTTAEIAYRMAKEPDRLYEVFQSEEKYLSMLRTIASDWHSLKRDKELVKSLRVSPCLGAYREIPMGHDVQDDDQAVREFQLAKAEDIFIIDDISGYHLFRNDVLAAPEEEELEGFYCSLGASVLSDSIQKHISLGPVAPRTVRLIDLQKLVLERTRLFMHSNSEGASHDARWLENNLEVEQVEFIKNKIFFSPKGVQKNSTCVNKTAAIVASKRLDKKYTLNVTPKWEFYDIAATIVRLVLKRPKMHSSLLLESLLSTDLLTLKHRGYNVDRILARKQAEAVLMEQARLKKVEEQRKVLELREMQRQEHQRQEHQRQDQHHHQQQQQNHRDIDDEKNVVMPGSFTDSPKRQRNPPDSTEESGNFLTRGFSKISKMIQESDNRGKDVGQNQPEVAQETRESIHSEGVKPTAPHRISTNLQRAIQAGRSHASSSVFTQPKTFDVREDKTFCDNRPGQDITYAAQTSTGMKVYTHNALTEQIRKEFIGNNAKALHVFSLLLNDIAEVFTLAPAVLHIYYHPDSETIAFNLDGALFCNIAFFLRLHAAEFISNNWSRGPFLYWWVTVCHELAHNISKEHGSKHSFYTESFVNEYFSPAMDMVLAKESKGKQRTEKVVKEKESLI